MSPDGEFVPCDPYDHLETAERIANQLGLKPYGRYYNNFDDVLFDRGWIKVHCRLMFDCGYGFSYNNEARHTDIQISMIKEFAERKKTKLSSFGEIELSALEDEELNN